MKKPAAITIVQIICIVFLVMGCAGLCISIWQGIRNGQFFSRLFTIGVGIAIVVSPLVYALRGLRQRKPYGRWLALAVLLAWLGFNLYQNPNPFRYKDIKSSGPLPTFDIKPEEQGGAVFAHATIQLGLLVLILNLLFSKSVKQYFQKEEPTEPNQCSAASAGDGGQRQ